ncbi:SRPBCC family protein [Ornithinibacillus sp. 179-J 7C1 HS]|uniref:SRPBCC family protein n=1 Tax=Ornithinibacillus sp. 179-J 7C1 HS TaxID=3142384 RepID=UPI0039A2109A
MEITTKMKISASANKIFEAIVDPVKIGNYWFSSSSDKWEEGKTITLRYDEYKAEGVIQILNVITDREIVFSWGSESNEETIVTINFIESNPTSTIIEITESGFSEEDPEIESKMLGQKEGWVYMLCCLKGYVEHGIQDMRANLMH